MAKHDLNKFRSLGIMAHIDAGKKTTTERVLYYTGVSHRIGEVHEGTAMMDWMEQERRITTTSAAAAAKASPWHRSVVKHRINITDTPGHVDFVMKDKRRLHVLCDTFGAGDSVMRVTRYIETVRHRADKYCMPRICFINKLGRDGTSFQEMSLVLLCIVKAGGDYVSLDAAFQWEGPGFILQDRAATITSTQECSLEVLQECSAQAIYLHTSRGVVSTASDPPPSDVRADNPDYVIYTSVSTVKPKGVTVEHRQLCNYPHVIFKDLAPTPSCFATATAPLWRPFSNTQVYRRDKQMKPVPVRASGEIYNSSTSVSRSYLNQPEMTAEKFIPHSFSWQAGARLDRTGDVARFLPGVHIEFPGRVDNQISIRGCRIALEEIEAALEQHPSVRYVFVLAREDEWSEKRLVGYVSSGLKQQGWRESGEVINDVSKGVSVAELNRYLRVRLSEYMVPSCVVVPDELLSIPNGKLDQRALPALGQSRKDGAPDHLAPLTLAEEIICSIWAEVLRLQKVRVEENFFEPGGHSPLVTQVMSHMTAALGIDLPLRHLFDSPTGRALALIRDEHLRNSFLNTPTPISLRPCYSHLPPSFAQQRLWFIDQLDQPRPDYNIQTPVSLSGSLNIKVRAQTLSEIFRCNEALRIMFDVVKGEPVQIIEPPEAVRLEAEDLLGRTEREHERTIWRLTREEAQQPFDLLSARMLRTNEAANIGRFYICTVIVSPRFTEKPSGYNCRSSRGHKVNDTINSWDSLDSYTFTALTVAASPQYCNGLDRRHFQYVLNHFAQTGTFNGQSSYSYNVIAKPRSCQRSAACEFARHAVGAKRFIDVLYNQTTFESNADATVNHVRESQVFALFVDERGLPASTQDCQAIPLLNQYLYTPF